MTADSPANRTSSGRSIHVQRAVKLLRAGLAGGLAATVLAVVGCAIAFGGWGAITALIAAAAVLAFYLIGQAVMVLSADFGAVKLMVISMCSYTGRVIGIGLLLVLFQNNGDQWPQLVPMAFVIGIVGVVVGWLAVEIWVFRRMRITIYDTEYVAPEQAAAGGSAGR
jgi:hypothetical protein